MATTLSRDELLDAIGNMTVLELSEFVKEFEEKFGVTAAAPVAVAAGPAAGGVRIRSGFGQQAVEPCALELK